MSNAEDNNKVENTDIKGLDEVEQTVRDCYSTWSESYYRDYYQSEHAYPPIHTKIVREELIKADVTSVIDAGCGPASMLRDLHDLNLERSGFDLTPEMVDEAKSILAAQGVPDTNIWTGSILDPLSFRKAGKSYDAALCFGVLPHIEIEKDGAALKNLVSAVHSGGLILVEARNKLFSLFTLNRYTRDFFREILIDDNILLSNNDPSEADALKASLSSIDKMFRLDLPPIRKGQDGDPGYDEVLSRTHNPFEMRTLAEQLGLVDIEILFYHYHALPPMLEASIPKTFRASSLELESPRDWRGHFLASAFILKATKA